MTAKKKTKKTATKGVQALEESVRSPSTHTSDLQPPAIRANNELLDVLVDLDSLAIAGDESAREKFYAIACSMVARLNDKHIGYAAAVIEWPILLPRDRRKRNRVARAANEMRIGAVKAGGKGAPENLSYNSEKGFALSILQRVDLARALVSPVSPAYKDANGIPIAPPSRINEHLKKRRPFRDATSIFEYNRELLETIASLPIYNLDTQSTWVEAMIEVLKQNPQLIPETIAKRNSTTSTVLKEQKGVRGETNPMDKDDSAAYSIWNNNSKFTNSSSDQFQSRRIGREMKFRGGRLKKTLSDGLRNVAAVPICWGD